MQNRNKELAINTVILGVGQLIPKILSVIILPILTTYLSTVEYGNYDLILSFASLMIPILTLQIQQAVFRYLLSSIEKKDKERYVSTSFGYVIISSLIILPIVFFSLVAFKLSFSSSILVCILFFSETLYNLLGQVVRGVGDNVKYSISVIVYAVINMTFTIVFVACMKIGIYGVILSLSSGYVASNLYMIIASRMYKFIRISNFSMKSFKELLGFSAPIVPSSIALWVVNLSDRLVIINYLGSAANGIYAVANKIPTLYSTAYSVFNLAWTETASRVSDDGNPEEYYSTLFRGLFNFLIGVMIMLIAATPLLFKVLVKGDYGSAIYQIPFLYIGVFFNSLVNFYSGIYIALKRTKQVGISSIVGAVLNLLINVVLINKIGLYAASISTAISFTVIALYRAYDLNKVIYIKYDFKEIIVGLLAFATSSVLLFINGNIPIFILIVITILYNLVFNKNIIFSLLTKLKGRK